MFKFQEVKFWSYPPLTAEQGDQVSTFPDPLSHVIGLYVEDSDELALDEMASPIRSP